MTTVAGLVLAGGAGRRMGRPKALVTGADGVAWVSRTASVVRRGGCDPVVVVVGAAADEVLAVLHRDGVLPQVRVVEATGWRDGMGASLRAGLQALEDDETLTATAALVMLVDTPDVGGDVVRRLVGAGSGPEVLARAGYGGRAGHPVLIGRGHWAGVRRQAAGDRGARQYLAARTVTLVECGDLAGGHDVDHPGEPG